MAAHATVSAADRLLEKIASGNVSDIGESDDEDNIPQEDVPRENCDTPSSTKGEDGGDRSLLKEIRVEDNVPKNFQWKKKVYAPPSDIDFSGHNECPPEADETCTPYTYFSRLGKCPLESKKVINKKPRRYSAEYVTSDDIVVVIWKDNNDVSVASNFVGIGNEEDVRRWDETKREHILVKQPEVIAKYNRSMGGVDKMDFLLSLYRTKIRGCPPPLNKHQGVGESTFLAGVVNGRPARDQYELCI
ncbi:hypothetical protein HPB51_025676 [Rhipicephalus microplus]|uniref:PiggyBac transposable element-derived protein domain-containing protein n=1 Tax=Rhipicephalus microplus TaxID=6941 RepID=A0A9J6EJA8_RHIMP|nr:hypothetical protein HPB51_025676 [Rhipicephalus microplus]